VKVIYCDFCGAKLKADDESYTVSFTTERKYGGHSKPTYFEGCATCIDAAHNMILKEATGKVKK
jgi:hypothetical protein